MTKRLHLSRGRLLAVAVAGTVCGHVVSYGVAFPERATRQSVLRLTGHAYWHAAVAASVLAAAWFAISHVARHFAAGRDRRSISSSITSVVPRLVAMQLAVFLGMEVSERIAAGAPISTVLDHRVLAIGLGVQVVVAGLLAVACHALGRVAEAAGAFFTTWEPPRRRVLLPAVAVQSAPVRVVFTPCGSRGPPLS